MINFELPTIKREIKDGNIVATKSKLNCSLDVSLAAQLKWEDKFPNEKIGIFDYVDMLKNVKEKTPALLLSELKALYCFIDFENDTSYINFLRLFDLSDKEYIEELAKTLHNVLELIYPDDKKKD